MKQNNEQIIIKENQRPIYFLRLLGLLVTIWLVYDNTKSVWEVKTTGQHQSTITAEDIQRILEINGASQIVTVENDTTFTSISSRELFGVRLAFLEQEESHQLKEVRTFRIKAGCNNFELEKGDTATLLIGAPVITSREHLSEQYTVVKRIGVWNPITLKQLEIKSRNEATAQAIADGILTEARFSIENGLRENLPQPLNIRWK